MLALVGGGAAAVARRQNVLAGEEFDVDVDSFKVARRFSYWLLQEKPALKRFLGVFGGRVISIERFVTEDRDDGRSMQFRVFMEPGREGVPGAALGVATESLGPAVEGIVEGGGMDMASFAGPAAAVGKALWQGALMHEANKVKRSDPRRAEWDTQGRYVRLEFILRPYFDPATGQGSSQVNIFLSKISEKTGGSWHHTEGREGFKVNLVESTFARGRTDGQLRDVMFTSLQAQPRWMV